MIWLTIAIVIISGLAGYAGYLLWQLRKRQQQQNEKLAELEALMLDEQSKRINSVRILAQGVLDDQLSLTEAAIRISALLDVLGQGVEARKQYAGLYQLADETLHIPRLQAWKALTRKQQRRYDAERVAAEKKYGEFVRASAQALVCFKLGGE